MLYASFDSQQEKTVWGSKKRAGLTLSCTSEYMIRLKKMTVAVLHNHLEWRHVRKGSLQ